MFSSKSLVLAAVGVASVSAFSAPAAFSMGAKTQVRAIAAVRLWGRAVARWNWGEQGHALNLPPILRTHLWMAGDFQHARRRSLVGVVMRVMQEGDG